MVVTDTGRHQQVVRRYYDVLAPGGLLIPSDLQSMGFGLPAAIAAALAAPGRPVVAVIGDGGFLMSGLELATAVREGVPLTVVVFSDGVYGQIRDYQLIEYGRAHGVSHRAGGHRGDRAVAGLRLLPVRGHVARPVGAHRRRDGGGGEADGFRRDAQPIRRGPVFGGRRAARWGRVCCGASSDCWGGSVREPSRPDDHVPSVGVALPRWHRALPAGRMRRPRRRADRRWSAAPPAPTVSRARTYTTNFPLTENPISEDGRWVNGGAVGLDWTNVSTTPGRAIGLQCCASYTDATALLTGRWGPDQQVTATVFAEHPRDECYQEVETAAAERARAAPVHGLRDQLQVLTNERRLPHHRPLERSARRFHISVQQKDTRYAVTTGDVVRARVWANVITAYKNGGNWRRRGTTPTRPGIRGWDSISRRRAAGCARTRGDYGYTSFTATDSL